MKPTLTPDVVNLVVAAREFWDANNDLSDESRALDKALEPFSSLVPYDNEPDDAALSVPAAAGVGEPVAWTGSGSMMALADGRNGFIWPTADEAHPIPLYAAPSAPDGWQPISEADKGIAYIHELAGLRIGNSYPIWARDEDGRVFECVWSDNGKKAYWWDLEGESPVDPVDFMPHPLASRRAKAEETRT